MNVNKLSDLSRTLTSSTCVSYHGCLIFLRQPIKRKSLESDYDGILTSSLIKIFGVGA